MRDEVLVLSMSQAVDAISQSQYVNLGWHIKFVDGEHVNEVYVNTGSGSFLFNLGGYSPENYVQHIEYAPEGAAEVYRKCKGVDFS